ncbi:MAG: hypothetical protein GW914_01145 [Candidatus Aenigmarchaeota archaeon]|nr:hypothetical protein [Candidatus Aenigmarchaeota archaeon]
MSKMETKQIAIGFLLLLVMPVFARAEPVKLETVYSMFAEIYKNDYSVLKNITSGAGTISTFPVDPKEYSIKVLGPRNEILFSRDIEPSFEVFLEPLEVIELNSTIIHTRVPYFDNAVRIKIYHLGKAILDVDLSKEICDNNFMCGDGENSYNCPSDCGTKKGFPWVMYIIIVLLLFALIILFLKFLRK